MFSKRICFGKISGLIPAEGRGPPPTTPPPPGMVSMRLWGSSRWRVCCFDLVLSYSPSTVVDLGGLWFSQISEAETKLKVLVSDCSTFHKGFWVKKKWPEWFIRLWRIGLVFTCQCVLEGGGVGSVCNPIIKEQINLFPYSEWHRGDGGWWGGGGTQYSLLLCSP